MTVRWRKFSYSYIALPPLYESCGKVPAVHDEIVSQTFRSVAAFLKTRENVSKLMSKSFKNWIF